MSAFNPNKKNFPALQKYVRNNSPRGDSQSFGKKLFLYEIISRKFPFCVEHSNKIFWKTQKLLIFAALLSGAPYLTIYVSRDGSIMVTNDVADRGPRPPGMWAQALGLVRAATH